MKDLYGTSFPAPENRQRDLSLPAAAAILAAPKTASEIARLTREAYRKHGGARTVELLAADPRSFPSRRSSDRFRNRPPNPRSVPETWRRAHRRTTRRGPAGLPRHLLLRRRFGAGGESPRRPRYGRHHLAAERLPRL